MMLGLAQSCKCILLTARADIPDIIAQFHSSIQDINRHHTITTSLEYNVQFAMCNAGPWCETIYIIWSRHAIKLIYRSDMYMHTNAAGNETQLVTWRIGRNTKLNDIRLWKDGCAAQMKRYWHTGMWTGIVYRHLRIQMYRDVNRDLCSFCRFTMV